MNFQTITKGEKVYKRVSHSAFMPTSHFFSPDFIAGKQMKICMIMI